VLSKEQLFVSFKLHDLFPRVRVPTGFLLAAFYFYYSDPSWESLAAGGSVALLGLMIRAWATGHLRKNDRLAVSGPYAFTRNPLYFGSFLIGIGFSLAGRDNDILIVFLVCFAVLYGPVMQQEIETLKHLFPEQYRSYQENVPLFFPRIRVPKGWGDFSFERYTQNREYQALLGFLSALAVLAAKIHYLHGRG
jgi:protein-S-isoprenylcysteine O-methyltransferase Ste14